MYVVTQQTKVHELPNSQGLDRAYMVIGYLHGMHAPDDDLANEKAAKMIQKFTADFKSKYGHSDCYSLLGIDLNTDEGKKEAEEKNLYKLKCEKFIIEIVDMLEKEYIILNKTPSESL